MSVLLLKLFSVLAICALGFACGRTRTLGGEAVLRALSNAAFYAFAPALLFRAAARMDFVALPWGALWAYFLASAGMLLLVYGLNHRPALMQERGAALPAVRGFTASFGNSVQLGIPVALSLFGEAGLALHLSIVSLHALVLLSLATLLAELDLARAQHQPGHSVTRTLLTLLRQIFIHPVILPVLAGLAWNLATLPLPKPLDETLLLLGQAVAPVCLFAIGLSLAYYGLRGHWQGALGTVLLKLVVQPALVWLLARFVFALPPLALAVAVMCAALPIGVNPMLFAQRYRTDEAQASAAVAVSTLGYALSAPLWLAWLALGPF